MILCKMLVLLKCIIIYLSVNVGEFVCDCFVFVVIIFGVFGGFRVDFVYLAELVRD